MLFDIETMELIDHPINNSAPKRIGECCGSSSCDCDYKCQGRTQDPTSQIKGTMIPRALYE
jgi:hypothetical protein